MNRSLPLRVLAAALSLSPPRRDCTGDRDLIAVAGDPLIDVGVLKNVQFVM